MLVPIRFALQTFYLLLIFPASAHPTHQMLRAASIFDLASNQHVSGDMQSLQAGEQHLKESPFDTLLLTIAKDCNVFRPESHDLALMRWPAIDDSDFDSRSMHIERCCHEPCARAVE